MTCSDRERLPLALELSEVVSERKSSKIDHSRSPSGHTIAFGMSLVGSFSPTIYLGMKSIPHSYESC